MNTLYNALNELVEGGIYTPPEITERSVYYDFGGHRGKYYKTFSAAEHREVFKWCSDKFVSKNQVKDFKGDIFFYPGIRRDVYYRLLRVTKQEGLKVLGIPVKVKKERKCKYVVNPL